MSFSEGLHGAFRGFVVVIATLLSPVAMALNAQQASDLLSTLHQVRVASYLAINGYYNYSISTGDKSLAAEVNNAVDQVDTNVKKLSTLPGYTDVEANMKAIAEGWKKYQDLLKTNMNDLKTVGYPDLRLAGDMAQANVDFNTAVVTAADNIKKTANFEPPQMLDLARESSVEVEQMMTKYAARSASTVSQVFQGADTEDPMDVMAGKFSALLDKMTKSSQNTPDSLKLLDDITTKWNFIKNSYIKYNENNVSYVVNLYSKKILENLEKLQGLYSAK